MTGLEAILAQIRTDAEKQKEELLAAAKQDAQECLEKAQREADRQSKAILEEAGLGMNNIIKTLVFIQDMNDFGAVNEIYAEYINGDVLPARSCVEVAKLPKGGLVEIEVIALKK